MPLDPVLKMIFALVGIGKLSFALVGVVCSHGLRERNKTNLLLHLAQNEKRERTFFEGNKEREQASSIDEQHIQNIYYLLQSNILQNTYFVIRENHTK
jgi:hypothetical protein